MQVEKWDKSKGELTLENIRKLYPGDKHRVSFYRYEQKDIAGIMSKEGWLFVLKGEVMIQCGTENATLKAGEMIEFPTGDYHFSVLGDQVAEVVKVWNLEEFLKSV